MTRWKVGTDTFLTYLSRDKSSSCPDSILLKISYKIVVDTQTCQLYCSTQFQATTCNFKPGPEFNMTTSALSVLRLRAGVSKIFLEWVTDCDTLFFLFLPGIFNTAFTKYVVEQPTSVVNISAMTAAESANKEQTPQPQTSATCNIKETEL